MIVFCLDFIKIYDTPNTGPDDKITWATTVQPVYPFSLGDEWKLVTYSIIPLVSQPGLQDGEGRSYGVGDSTFFGYFVPPNEGKFIWGFGPGLQVPTHTDPDLGVDEWAAGPSLIMVVQPGQWSIFGIFDNLWSFAGPGKEDVNLFNFQYQAVRLLPNDWFFITNWTIEADWEAAASDQWTVPVGGGFGKAFKLGGKQYQAYGQIGYNVVRPDDAASWRAILALTRVF
ncbi:MAG: neuromedin U [Verrucomicrobiota bacterium]